MPFFDDEAYRSCKNCGWFEKTSLAKSEDEGICTACPPTTTYNPNTLTYTTIRTHTMKHYSGCRFWKPDKE